jgi:hypothetical protein
LVHEVKNRKGRINILVNNAGMARGGKQPGNGELETLSLAEWQEQFAMTLQTAFLMTRAILPIMKEQNYGRIVNVSSVTGPLVSNAGWGAYGATKGALDGMMRAVAIASGRRGITINAVAPGWVRTGSSTPEELEAGKHTPPRAPWQARRGSRGGSVSGLKRSGLHNRSSARRRRRKYSPGSQEGLKALPETGEGNPKTWRCFPSPEESIELKQRWFFGMREVFVSLCYDARGTELPWREAWRCLPWQPQFLFRNTLVCRNVIVGWYLDTSRLLSACSMRRTRPPHRRRIRLRATPKLRNWANRNFESTVPSAMGWERAAVAVDRT